MSLGDAVTEALRNMELFTDKATMFLLKKHEKAAISALKQSPLFAMEYDTVSVEDTVLKYNPGEWLKVCLLAISVLTQLFQYTHQLSLQYDRTKKEREKLQETISRMDDIAKAHLRCGTCRNRHHFCLTNEPSPII